MSQELASSVNPADAESIPVFRKIDGQEPGKPKKHEQIAFDDQRSFLVGDCKVIPLRIEIYSEPNRVGWIRSTTRYGLQQALWAGITSQPAGKLIPGTSTEVRLVDGAPKRTAVFLTPAKAGGKLEVKDIPECLKTFVREVEGKFYGENLPEGLLAQLQQDTENLSLGVPQFHLPQKTLEQFPRGGHQGFVNEMMPSLERHSRELTRIFGPFFERNITVRWNSRNDTSVQATAHTKLTATFDDRTHELWYIECEGTPDIDFTGDIKSENLDTDVRHELTHAVLREALPSDENIQESAAVFMEHTLEGPYDQQMNVHTFDYESLDIISGGKELAIPYTKTLKHEGNILQAHRNVVLREFLRIAGGRGNFLRILQASKKVSLKKKPNAEGRVRVPSMDEWLTIANSVVPTFAGAYRSSVLSKPLKEGDRIIFGKHNQWGFTVAFSRFTLHPAMPPALSKDEPPSYGKLSGREQTITLRFPDTLPGEFVNITTTAGSFIVSSGFVMRGLQTLSAGAQLTKGSRITAEVPGLSEPIELIWDEQAQAMCESSSNL